MYENEYLETQVMTAPGPQLHLMVVDGSIRFARQGKLALQEKDFELSHECLNRSREFLSEMISGLNPEVAPEMVGSLKQLFAYIYRELALADINHQPEHIDNAIQVLEKHRAAWVELIEQLPTQFMQKNDARTDWKR